jgi:hypothetical protein
MKRAQDSEGLIEQYLLGELSAAERTALEIEYLSDKAKHDQVCRIEDDLLDRYAQGALSPTDRERVERQYLTNPWRRRRLEFAKALAQVIDGELAARSAAKRSTEISWRSQLAALPRGPRLALALTPAIALIVFVGTWFAIETSRLRAQLGDAQREIGAQQQRAQTQARQIAELEAQHKRLREEHDRLQAQMRAVKEAERRPSHTDPVFLSLSVEAFRSSGAQGHQTLVIPHGVTEARLRLYLPENAFPSYRVILLGADGTEAFSKNGLRPRAGREGDFVIVNLPEGKLADGGNILALSGISDSGEAEPLGKTLIKVIRR